MVEKDDTKKIYALKILKKKMIINEGLLEKLYTEKEILSKIKHPFLVGLDFAFQDKENIYFVMPFYRGGDLFYHLSMAEGSVMNEERVKFYAAEIFLGISYLHSKNIIHRDIKPENVLMDDKGHLGLADFGISKQLENDGSTKSLLGNPEYIAPEILNLEDYGMPADWWSYGSLV